MLGTMAGAPAELANMTIQQKVEASASVTAMGMDGIVYFQNPDTGKNEYRVRLEIPKDISSKVSKDDVHMHIEYPPNKSVSDIVKKLKKDEVQENYRWSLKNCPNNIGENIFWQ